VGKGDNRRPRDEQVSDREWAARWERTFSPPMPSREAPEAPKEKTDE